MGDSRYNWPQKLSVTAAILLGAAGGIGLFTFIYADGASYLGNDASTCANCHIMKDHYDAWSKSSHKAVAACNDCHAPHDNVIEKYWVKGRNGFAHSLAFTTGRYPDPLRITDFNRSVTERACRDCHSAVVHQIDALPPRGSRVSCIRCHSEVGHAD